MSNVGFVIPATLAVMVVPLRDKLETYLSVNAASAGTATPTVNPPTVSESIVIASISLAVNCAMGAKLDNTEVSLK